MPLASIFSILHFAYLSRDDLISLLGCDNPNQSFQSFDPFIIMDDIYNVDLDISLFCSRYLNVPRPDYIFIHTFPSINTDYAAITALFSKMMRSIPPNF